MADTVGRLVEAGRTVAESSPIRILIVEDDPGICEDLRAFVRAEPDTAIVGEADSGVAAIESVKRLTPDVVLLEMDLPEMNGIEVVRSYGVGQLPLTIFIADHDRHAAAAFQVNAFDYVLKPLTDRRLHATLNRVRRYLRRERLHLLSEGLEALLAKSRDARRYQQHLGIRSRGQILILRVDEIDWVEADAKYCNVHIRATAHRVHEAIGHIELRLDPERFVRIHRSAIVNIDRVVEVISAPGSQSVVLTDGTHVPMSRSDRLPLIGFDREEE